MHLHLKALPTIEAEREQIQKATGFEPSTCDCIECQDMCEACPCLGTPKEISKLIEAGYGDRIGLTTWLAGLRFGVPRIDMLQAEWDSKKGSCTFFTDGKCELHDKGLKPTEGRLASCENSGIVVPGKLPLPVAVAVMWAINSEAEAAFGTYLNFLNSK